MTEQQPTPPSARLAEVPSIGKPFVKVPIPDVHLVAVVDLTGRFDSHDEVSRALYEQTIRASDCHTAVVQLGEDAIGRHLELARAIAGAFFLSAQRIEIHVPAGTRHAHFAQRVQRELVRICADHERMIANTRAPG